MRVRSRLALSCVLWSIPAVAAAQDLPTPPAADEGEIVVTARKRAESIQTVPVSVTAVDAVALTRLNVRTIADIRVAPNVEIAPAQIQPSGAVFYIRGVGNKAQEPFIDTPVAVSIDGVYLASSSGALIDLFDVQQVEILRGPQGTLQGRNSPGGAVNVTTRRPGGEISVEGELGYGRFHTFDAKLAVEAPILDDRLAARASLLVTHGGGGIRNLFDGSHLGGRKVYAGRLSLLFTPSPDFDLFVSGDYTANRSEQPGTRAANTSLAYPRQPVPLACSLLGFCATLKPWTVNTDFNTSYHSNGGGISANANLRLGGATITSVTGYRRFKERQSVDVDGLPVPFIHVVDRSFDLDQFSQELRIASDRGGAPAGGEVDWVVGGIYFDSSYDLVQPSEVFGARAVQYAKQKLSSYALFGQATYHLTDAWSISAGLRQTWDRKKYRGIQSGFTPADEVAVRGRFDNLSLEAGTEYRVTRDHLVYARFAQGYRAGGINGGAALPENVDIFGPEKVDSYEIGAKTSWLDRRLIVNLALFQADYKGLQREVVLPDNVTATAIRNAANARIKGAELEVVVRPDDRLTLRFGYGYLDAEYRSFLADLLGTGVPVDNTGLRLPFTPRHSVTLDGDYRIPVASGDTVTLAGNLAMKSAYTVQPTDTRVGREDGYVTLDLSIRYDLAGPRIGAELYAQNIFGSHYIIAGENLGGAANYQIDGPRPTYGGRLFFKF